MIESAVSVAYLSIELLLHCCLYHRGGVGGGAAVRLGFVRVFLINVFYYFLGYFRVFFRNMFLVLHFYIGLQC